MSAPLIIIGSGFAAYQLIKILRRQNAAMPIQVITSDAGDEYNKPDLSHVFSRKQEANELILLKGAAFAAQHQVSLLANTRVERIDAANHCVIANGVSYPYAKLVLATGAKAFVPKLAGDGTAEIVTLNSLQEYRDAQQRITAAARILIMGGGLIGVELAMDLAASGKQVHLVEASAHLLSNLMPDFVATALEQQLRSDGIKMDCNNQVTSINKVEDALLVSTSNGAQHQVDCVISAAGLVPNTQLAQQAGAKVNRGIMVDSQLKTSLEDVYALGDCAEINGKVMSYLQPIVLSANALAKLLLSDLGELTIPAMMIKVKTPSYPIQLGGHFSLASNWKVEFAEQGLTARAYDQQQRLTGFVVTKQHVSQAFPLLREVQLAS